MSDLLISGIAIIAIVLVSVMKPFFNVSPFYKHMKNILFIDYITLLGSWSEFLTIFA